MPVAIPSTTSARHVHECKCVHAQCGAVSRRAASAAVVRRLGSASRLGSESGTGLGRAFLWARKDGQRTGRPCSPVTAPSCGFFLKKDMLRLESGNRIRFVGGRAGPYVSLQHVCAHVHAHVPTYVPIRVYSHPGFVCMSIHLSAHTAIHTYPRMPIHMPVHKPVHMSTHMFMSMPAHMSAHMSAHTRGLTGVLDRGDVQLRGAST